MAAAKARLLLIFTYRPDFDDEWRTRPNYHQLRLDPLAGDSLVDLLQSLLGADPSVSALKPFLMERASGNPFFVEEIVRTLVEKAILEGERGSYRLTRPISSIEVPPTVRAVLAARIDALPPAEKRLLQAAAVIGKDVQLTLLRAISGAPDAGPPDASLNAMLEHLQAAEFLFNTQIFPDLQFTFKHALTHDVAYGGVLHERRREIHAAVVDAMEKLHGERLGEQIDRLAHHAVQGGLHEKAAQYLWQAGSKAAARSALADARGCFEQALGALQSLPESQATLERAFDIRIELRRILRQAGEGRQMLEQLKQAAIVAERLKDQRRLGQVYAQVTTVHSSLGEVDEAVATGERALEIAGQLGDVKLRIVANSNLQQAFYLKAEHRRVLELTSENLVALSAGLEQDFMGMAPLPSVYCRAYGMMSLAEAGRFAEAAGYAAEAIRIAEPTQHPHTVGWAYFGVSVLHILNADWAKASTYVGQLTGLLRVGNVPMLLPWAIAASAWVLAELGDADQALRLSQEAERLLEDQGVRGIFSHRGWALSAVGRAHLRLGRLDDARRMGDRAVAASGRQPGSMAHALRLLGDVAAHPDRFDARGAEIHYRDAIALAEPRGMRLLLAHCQLGLGTLHGQAGRTGRAREQLAEAAGMFRAIGMPLPLVPGMQEWRDEAFLKPNASELQVDQA